MHAIHQTATTVRSVQSQRTARKETARETGKCTKVKGKLKAYQGVKSEGQQGMRPRWMNEKADGVKHSHRFRFPGNALGGRRKRLVSDARSLAGVLPRGASAMAMASLRLHLHSPPPALSSPQVRSGRRFYSSSPGFGIFTPLVRVPSVSSERRGVSESCIRIRAVSVSGDTEQKESDVKKRTSYRPVVILPGLGNNTGDYNELVASLAARGLTAVTARVSRPDWLRNAAGLLDASYWRGTLQPRPTLDWYLERIKNAIQEAKAMAPESGKVTIIAHSAGGWLGRVYMADFGTDDVALFLTLGSPHLPPPRNVPGVVDQTRGLLYYVEENCPGAFHAPDVKYVCIAGRYLKGDRLFPENGAATVAPTGLGTVGAAGGSTAVTAAEEGKLEAGVGEVIEDGAVKPAPPTLRARIVGQGYKQVCGQADVWGDGVVPEISAHLEGAENLTFEGVYHSPVGASDERPWYGTSKILDQWVHYLME